MKGESWAEEVPTKEVSTRGNGTVFGPLNTWLTPPKAKPSESREYIYGKKRKDVADKLAEVQRERGGGPSSGCWQPHRYGPPGAVDGL
jgi:hypothetical protein